MSLIDSIKPFMTKALTIASNHVTEISVTIGITGFVGTIFGTVAATKKAEAKVAEVQESRKRCFLDENTNKWVTGDPEPMTKADVIKIKAPYYIPVAIGAVASAGCIIFGTRQSLVKNAALTTALTVSDQAFRDYKKAAEEQIKEMTSVDKVDDVKQKIQDKAAKKTIKAAEAKSPAPVAISGADGKLLCYERYSGRYFYSTMEDIKKACNNLNRNMRDENYISLNEFYYEVGLDETALGHELGWHIDRGYLDPIFGSTLTADDRLAMTVDFEVPPRTDFGHVL